MQKIFNKYAVIIMTTAILSILVVNFFFTANSLEKQQFDKFNTKIDQIIHTMENNKEELNTIEKNLNEGYLTRAKAAAYVIERNEEVLESVEELQNLAELLNVDELHVIDAEGILRYSSVPEYIGMDFHEGEQTREFLSILEAQEKDSYIIQEIQPNAAEGKIMKYVGVARKGEKGIVQVGLEPVRQMEVQARNTYEYIFSRFPVEEGEEYFAVDREADKVIGHTNDSSLAEEHWEEYHQKEWMESCETGAWRRMEDGRFRYVVTRQYEDVLIGGSLPVALLFRELWMNTFTTLLYLLVVGAVVIIFLNYLVKKKVVDGIHRILKDLVEITNGNLGTRVAVGGNQEFEALSQNINAMVKSVINTSDRIAKIIDMSEIPLAAFECMNSMNYVFATSKLKGLLNLSEEEEKELYGSPELFYQKIQRLMQQSTGEKDVFQIGGERYVRIHVLEEEEGCLGVVTDVTKDVLEKQKIQYDSNHDQLTGLSRYRYFKSRAAKILGKLPPGKICAVVMMDLDEFKGINDTYGHNGGDIYLQSFAALLKSLPKEHCLTARRSGDEFCMMLFHYENKEDAVQVLHGFWQELKQKEVKLSEQHTRRISASGGVAWTKDAQADLDVLLSQADEALYEVKRRQKGNFAEY